MKFIPAPLRGIYIIEIERYTDERGFFGRLFGVKEFTQAELPTRFVETSISYSRKKGTLRGMHYQKPPYGETKLVYCSRGRVYCVAVDLRSNSPTFKQWFSIELKADERRQLLVPEGFALGFITLEDDSEVIYQISQFHTPEAAAGFRYDDPALAINWPMPPTVISDRDRNWPDFKD